MSLILMLGCALLILWSFKLIQSWIFRDNKFMDIPGPKGWPIFGNALQMHPANAHITIGEWSKEYGNIFKIRIFNKDIVVLNDYESIKQMLTSEDCSSRPQTYRTQSILLRGVTDIALGNPSPEWNYRKKTLSRSLNAYGPGSIKIERITMESIDQLLGDILADSKKFTKCIDLQSHIHVCIAGIITTLFYGRRLEESKLIELLGLEKGVVQLISPVKPVAVLDIFPWMRYFPIKSIQEPIRNYDLFRKWLLERQIEVSTEADKNDQGILASLRLHINKITSKSMTSEELVGITANIILGGFATSTALLYSLILILINLPDVQEKMYNEIDDVTKGRRPEVSDFSKMTYVKAVMMENLRYSTLLPLGMPHYSHEDTSIIDKHIPRGTMLMANFWRLHHDERHFDDPWNFRPERFLTPDGEMLSNKDAVFRHCLPFSAGRRICPGEGLARNRTFLIIASLLQRYKFLPEDPQNVPSCDPHDYDSAQLLKPFGFKVQVIER